MWNCDSTTAEWDALLTILGGHPLQSALWGDARRLAENVEDRRWVAFAEEAPVWMGRFEIRDLPIHGRVAWLPRGPVWAGHELTAQAHQEFLARISDEGYLIAFLDPYRTLPAEIPTGVRIGGSPRTLWLDLKQGKDLIFKNLHKKLRYGVRAAERAGVVVEESRRPQDVAAFYGLCDAVSDSKDFSLPGSEALMQALVADGELEGPVRAHLFVAQCEGQLASGYLSIAIGRRLHNMWNATDRAFAKQSPGEAVLWHQVSWAVDAGLTVYDQEGIDEVNNPGCYQFKKRLGGEEVALPGLHAYPLGLMGRAALTLGQWLGKI